MYEKPIQFKSILSDLNNLKGRAFHAGKRYQKIGNKTTEEGVSVLEAVTEEEEEGVGRASVEGGCIGVSVGRMEVGAHKRIDGYTGGAYGDYSLE